MAAKEIWKAVAMADHFEKIQKLPDPVPGCPNFRRVPGYKVTQNNFEILDTKNTFEMLDTKNTFEIHHDRITQCLSARSTVVVNLQLQDSGLPLRR